MSAGILYLSDGDRATPSRALPATLQVVKLFDSTSNGGMAARHHIEALAGSGGFFAGVEATAVATNGWTPTSLAGGPIGLIANGVADRPDTSVWGANVRARAKNGATGVPMCGLEVNLQAEPGSQPLAAYGVQVVPTAIDTATGDGPQPLHSAIGYRLIGKAVHGSQGYRYGFKMKEGFVIENLSGGPAEWSYGGWPLTADATAFSVRSNDAAHPQTIRMGIEFRNIEITDYAWRTERSAITGQRGWLGIGDNAPVGPLVIRDDSEVTAILFRGGFVWPGAALPAEATRRIGCRIWNGSQWVSGWVPFFQ